MNIILCNLKKITKKTDGGEVHLVDLLVTDGINSSVVTKYIDKELFDILLPKYNKSQNLGKVMNIDQRFLKPVLYKDTLTCTIDFKNYLNSI